MAGKADIEAGRAFVRLYLKNDMTKALSRSLKNAGKSMQSFGRGVQSAAIPIMAAGGAITAGFGAAVMQFARTGDELDKMSKRTGVGASALAELGFAAEQSGTDMGTVEKAIKRQSKIIYDLERGLSTATDAFGALGLGIQDVQGLKPEDQFGLIADRLAAIEDPARRAALAQEIFGRAGTSLIPMLGNMKELRKEARDLGIIPSNEEVENAAKVTDAINRVKRAIGGAFFSIGATIAEPVLQALDAIKRVAVAAGQWMRENQGLVRTIAAIGVGLFAAGGAIFAFGTAIVGTGMALSALGTVIGAVSAAVGVLLSPIGLLVAAIVAGAVAFIKYTDAGQSLVDWFTGTFGDAMEQVKDAFGGIADAIMSGDLELAGQIAMAGLNEAWKTGLATLMENWGGWITATVEVFAGAMASISKLWIGTQGKISKGILDMANQQGIVGDVMAKLTGVDIRKEKTEGDRKRMQKGALSQKVREWRSMLESTDGPVSLGGEEYTREEVQGWIDKALGDMQSEGYGLTPEQLETGGTEEAKDIVDQQTEDAIAGLENTIGGMLNSFASATDPEELRRQIAEERANRQRMQTEARTMREQQATTAAEDTAAEPPPETTRKAVVGQAMQLTATYSAAAASVAGYGGTQSPQDELLAETKTMVDQLESAKEALAKIADAGQATVTGLVRLAGSLVHG